MKNWFRAYALLALAVAVTSCDSNPLIRPADVAVVHTTSANAKPKEAKPYRLVPGDEPAVTHSTVIGSLGGVLYFGNHSIQVPAGAVSKPTLFTGTQVGDGFVHVELAAHQRDANGAWTVDVGHAGFAKPITLKLSYANASGIKDRGRLTILYLEEGTVDGSLAPVPSGTNRVGRWIFARINHFSGYGAGEGRSGTDGGE